MSLFYSLKRGGSHNEKLHLYDVSLIQTTLSTKHIFGLATCQNANKDSNHIRCCSTGIAITVLFTSEDRDVAAPLQFISLYSFL